MSDLEQEIRELEEESRPVPQQGSGKVRRYFLSNLFGTFVSRIFGFLREVVVGGVFGASQSTDLFVVAFTIPTLFRRVLGEDMVERALLPSFKALIEQGKKKEAWDLISRLGNLMVIVLLVAMAFCYLFARKLVDFIAPGLDGASVAIAVKLTYIVLPFMLFIGIYALLGGMLLFLEEVNAFAFSPIMLSVGVIAVVPFFSDKFGAKSLAAGFLVGGIFQALFCVPFLYRKRLRKKYEPSYTPAIAVSGERMRIVGRETFWITISAVAVKAVDVVDRMLASHLPAGSISSLYFADRLNELPLAILGLTLARAILPPLTDAAARQDMADFTATLIKGLRYNVLLVVPVSFLTIGLSLPIVQMIYQRGAFDVRSASMTALALSCYAAGLLGLTAYNLLTRSFSALIHNRAAVLISLTGMVITIGLKALLVNSSLKHGGLALATSISFTGMSLALLFALRRMIVNRGGDLALAAIFRPLGISLLSAAIAAAWSRLLFMLLIRASLTSLKFHWIDVNTVAALGVAALAGIIVYGGLLAFFGISEVRTAWNGVMRRVRRR